MCNIVLKMAMQNVDSIEKISEDKRVALQRTYELCTAVPLHIIMTKVAKIFEYHKRKGMLEKQLAASLVLTLLKPKRDYNNIQTMFSKYIRIRNKRVYDRELVKKMFLQYGLLLPFSTDINIKILNSTAGATNIHSVIIIIWKQLAAMPAIACHSTSCGTICSAYVYCIIWNMKLNNSFGKLVSVKI